MLHYETAVFTGCFNGYVANAKHSLSEGLDHTHVLHFGKLYDASGFRCEAYLVAQLVAGNGELDGLALNVALYGPQQQDQ